MSSADSVTPQKAAKVYGPLGSVSIAILAFIAAQIIASATYYIVARMMGLDPTNGADVLGANPWAQFVVIGAAEVVMVGGIWYALKYRKGSFKDIGLNKPKLAYVWPAIGGFIMYIVLYVMTLTLVRRYVPGIDLEQKQELGFSNSTTGAALIPIFISLVVMPPIAEEIVTRGFIFTGLRTKLPFIVSAVITSALFAAAHLGEASDGLLWVAAIDTFILSMVMCGVRERTKSLWPSIGMHVLKNGLAFFVLFNIAQYFR